MLLRYRLSNGGIDKKMSKQWEVYIIRSKLDRLYTGITNDLDKRFATHQQGKGARFFNFSAPDLILYREKYPNRSEASKREAEIKKMTRLQKLELIRTTLMVL